MHREVNKGNYLYRMFIFHTKKKNKKKNPCTVF